MKQQFRDQIQSLLDPIQESFYEHDELMDSTNDTSQSERQMPSCATRSSGLIRNFAFTDLPSLLQLQKESQKKKKKAKLRRKSQFNQIQLSFPERNLQCSVCQKPFRGGLGIQLKKCGHLSHKACHQQWLRHCEVCLVCFHHNP